MWLISEHGFLSLVQDRDDPGLLQVRGRDPQDIRTHFPAAEVYVADGGDYRYRARISREEVADRLAEAVRRIDYTSHAKDVMAERSPANPARLGALYGVWHSLSDLQDYRPYSTVPRSAEPAQWWDEDEL